MPLMSIIVPIYNVKEYLPQCIESICAQTLSDIEIICVDDGSTDGSTEILRSYANYDSRIIPIFKSNTGYGNTMNIGISRATGDYIGIVESDDFADKKMFDTLYHAALKYNVDVVKSNYYIYKSEPEEIILLEALKKCQYNNVFCPIEQQEIFDIQPSIWSGIYKRGFLFSSGIRFLETPGASFQDTSFIFKVWLNARRVCVIKEAFLYYRCDNPLASVRSQDKAFCICREFDEIERVLNQDTEKQQKLQKIFLRRKFNAYKWNYFRLEGESKKIFLEKFISEFRVYMKLINLDGNVMSEELINSLENALFTNM